MGASFHLYVRRWGGVPSNLLKPSSIVSVCRQQARLSSCTQLIPSIFDLQRTCSPVPPIRPCIDAFDETRGIFNPRRTHLFQIVTRFDDPSAIAIYSFLTCWILWESMICS